MIKAAERSGHATEVAQRIRDDIVAGCISFGERLTIDALASRYAVSHMPVREALRELHGEGLVVSEPNRGARVRTIDVDFVHNVFENRIALEMMLARRAAQRSRAADVDMLRAIEDDLEREIDAADYPAVVGHNKRLHQAINRLAGNDDALPIVDRHWTLLAALWSHYGYGESRFAGVANDHRHLITAIAAHDGDAAALIMGAHTQKARLVLLERVAARPASPVVLRRQS